MTAFIGKVTLEDRHEAGRILDEDHPAEPQDHSPFCVRCAFYASDFSGKAIHIPVSSSNSVRTWLRYRDERKGSAGA